VDGGPDQLVRRIEALGADTTSGASAIVAEAVAILLDARGMQTDLHRVTQSICMAQPMMAPVWNAAAAALSDDPDQLNQFAERLRRAPAALSRFAATHFADENSSRPMRVVTLSRSSSVLTTLHAIRAIRPLEVSCSESRPALEGRRLASDLAAAGIPVTFYGDAALAHALNNAEAVLVGADAVASSWFLNKSGTKMLAATATHHGVPVYVAATRDKFADDSLASRLQEQPRDPKEVWDSPPHGVQVHNGYFEATPLDLVTAVISDIGVLGTGMVPDVCARSTSHR
jgi:translation initiation factor 2B subunit (eIF-2B alpha/beta/delta family)